MQGHGGILGRAGAAHAAKAIVADQDGRPQAPVDCPVRPASDGDAALVPPWHVVDVASPIDEGREGTKRLVPAPEAFLVGRMGEARDAFALVQCATGRLAAELPPDIGEILEQHPVRHFPEMRDRQAGCFEGGVPRTEATRHCAGAELPLFGVEVTRDPAVAACARHATQIGDQLRVRNVPAPEADLEMERGERHCSPLLSPSGSKRRIRSLLHSASRGLLP